MERQMQWQVLFNTEQNSWMIVSWLESCMDEYAWYRAKDKRNSKVSVPQTVFGVDKYKETIKKADDYFKMKRWAEAKPVYEEALKQRPDDPYATSKLEIVNKNLNAPKWYG